MSHISCMNVWCHTQDCLKVRGKLHFAYSLWRESWTSVLVYYRYVWFGKRATHTVTYTPRTRCGESHGHHMNQQHTATHCNALQRTATHCNALQHTATTHCNMLGYHINKSFLSYEWVMSHVWTMQVTWMASSCRAVCTWCKYMAVCTRCKEPISPQKSPISPQMSPRSLWKSPIMHRSVC